MNEIKKHLGLKNRMPILHFNAAFLLVCLGTHSLHTDCSFSTAYVKNGHVEAEGDSIPVYKLKGKVKVSRCEGGAMTLYYPTQKAKVKLTIGALKAFYQDQMIFGQRVGDFAVDEHGFEKYQICSDHGDGVVIAIGPLNDGNGAQVYIKKGCPEF